MHHYFLENMEMRQINLCIHLRIEVIGRLRYDMIKQYLLPAYSLNINKFFLNIFVDTKFKMFSARKNLNKEDIANLPNVI